MFKNLWTTRKIDYLSVHINEKMTEAHKCYLLINGGYFTLEVMEVYVFYLYLKNFAR